MKHILTDKYRIIADHTYDWEFWLDPQGTLIYTSLSCERITGYSPSDFYGDPNKMLSIIHPKDRKKWAKHEQEAHQVREQGDAIFRIIRSDSEIRWIEHYCLPVFEEDRFLGIRGSNRDITERIRIEERNRMQSQVIQGINEILHLGVTIDDEERLAQSCLTICEKITESKFGFIGELSPAGKLDTIAISNPGWNACKMPDSDAVRVIRDMEVRGIWSVCLKTGKPAIINQPDKHPKRVGVPEGHPPIKCYLGVPLFQGDSVTGVISLGNKPGSYSKEDATQIEQIGVAFYEALMRIRVRKELLQYQEKLELMVEERTSSLVVSEEKFRNIFENSPVGKSLTGVDGSLHVNRAFCEMLGYTEEELKAKPWKEITHSDDIAGSEEVVQSLLEGRAVTRLFEKRYLHKEGHVVWTLVSTTLQRDPDNKPQFFITSIQDITMRKQAEEALLQEKEYAEGLLNSLPGVFYQINTDGRFVRWNDNFLAVTGYNHEEFSKLGPLDLFEGEDQKHIAQRIQAVFESGSSNAEASLTTRDGRKIPYQFSGHMINLQDTPYLVGMGIDISELHEGREKMKHLLDELTLSNKDLEQFAYVASHDLQEPLRVVAGYVQLLAKRYRGKLDTDADEFIDYAVDGTNRMQQLINDLLSFSRVGTRGKPFQEWDLNTTLKSVLRDIDPLVQESGIKIKLKELPVVSCDPTQIHQVFQNLLVNAIKFRDPDRKPEVSITSITRKHAYEIIVQDNGIGIDPKYFDKIFEIFQRLNLRSMYQGTGIGLAIVKRIITRHQGQIWVVSGPGKGAAFHFTLPMNHIKKR